MSRIFSISGNFMQYGKWSTPDPSFEGKIVVNDKNELHGYCKELYEADMSDVNRTRYLVGVLDENPDGRQSIAFCKLSNDPVQAPLLYTVANLADQETGMWCALCLFMFVPQGEARITLKEEAYSKKEEDNIDEIYQTLDKDINGNGDFLEDIDFCREFI